jgi:poly(3-hydroxybutyrate) depolymerase
MAAPGLFKFHFDYSYHNCFMHTIPYKADPTGNYSKSIAQNGIKRAYHLHIPSSYRESIAAPLVVALHGGGGNGQKMEKLSRLSLLADQAGFIVAYPDAVERHWNDGRGLSKYRSQRENIDFWVLRNGCSADPEITLEPDTDPEDGTRVRKSVYGQCADGAAVVLYEVKGGGHTWPGGYQYLPEFLIGKTNRDLNASEAIWNFFKTFGK